MNSMKTLRIPIFYLRSYRFIAEKGQDGVIATTNMMKYTPIPKV